LLQELVALAKFEHLGLLDQGETLTNALFDVDLAHPATEIALRDTKVVRYLT
jgi:hypothetical protein